ncbi:MAG: chromosome segregation protein SMC [Planctomycetia bacterium]|nr:chromosome segregation protein SMC [Planctomycetia bacterium]
MLKSIEISGFKSFADPTRMVFTEGISALVGPNGSGKSNIVDAIKWVLGEQSVKKLRGKEMTDVIFNGSASRQPMNCAEVTLTFDNSKKIFATDASEVHITRRVYRSGESEYLVNRQASRLRDIRDILCGTGLGLQAYSIIEQGRVESLLMSSALQRRTIIEEAAGTAVYASNKQLTQRRLEHIEQNLVRIKDIVNDVESQLRSTKSQAGKAQHYRQYTQRLTELRSEANIIAWLGNQQRVNEIQKRFNQCRATEELLATEAHASEVELAELSQTLEKNEESHRRLENEMTSIREKIAADESARDFQMNQVETLEREIMEHGHQLLKLNVRNGDAEDLMRQTDDEIFLAEKKRREVSNSFSASNDELENLSRQVQQLESEEGSVRRDLQQQNVAISRLAGEFSGVDARLAKLESSIADKIKSRNESHQQAMKIAERCSELEDIFDELSQRARSRKERLDSLSENRKGHLEELKTSRQELSELRLRQSRIVERVSILQDLVKKHDGLSPGVRDVLANMSSPESPFRFAHGTVADLIHVEEEAAGLIELALGQAAQYIVISPEPELIRYIENNSQNFAGRVEFMWIDTANSFGNSRLKRYDNRPGVLGRADQFVETQPQFENIVKRLLARTWIVESMSCAKSLYRESDGHTNFLTLAGECLGGDGTLKVGPVHGVQGLISRRSELRTLTEQLSHLDQILAEKEISVELLESRTKQDESDLETASADYQKAMNDLEKLRLKQSETRQSDLHAQNVRARIETEIRDLTSEQEKLLNERNEIEAEKLQFEETVSSLDAKLRLLQENLASMLNLRKEQSQKTTNLKIELAKNEERIDFLSARKKQYRDSLDERNHLLLEHSARFVALKSRRDQAELTVLRIQSGLASLYVQKERTNTELVQVSQSRAKRMALRNRLTAKLKKTQSELAKNREELHLQQIELERITQEQKTLVARAREDFGIEIGEDSAAVRHFLQECDSSQAGPPEDENATTADNDKTIHSKDMSDDTYLQQRIALLPEHQKEIESLKTKLQQLGNVNLAALETLEELEERYENYFRRYNDILASKRSLQKTIERIDQYTQKLFEDAFDSVKIYFAEIFQQLFGGGHADLLLESPDSPLESGVDIVVRPPGKELKSVMLLSGGEKTLTCVAFLLAIFRYRHNPVCILDEVDAALDEGNVGRFIKVVEKLQLDTQFLIITHSKKTMTVAKVLYGVTMEDSGVSKLIGVQFDQVGENGEILIRKGDSDSHASRPAEGVA